MFAFIPLWIRISSFLLDWGILITLREGKMTLGVISQKTGFRLSEDHLNIQILRVAVFWLLENYNEYILFMRY